MVLLFVSTSSISWINDIEANNVNQSPWDYMCLRLYINTFNVVGEVVSTRTSSNYDTKQKKKIIYSIECQPQLYTKHQREPEPVAEYKHHTKEIRMRTQHTAYYILLL